MRRLAILLAMCVGLVTVVTACNLGPQVFALGGTGQIWVRTDPGAHVALYDADGDLVPTLVLPPTGDPVRVDERVTDANGFVVLRYLEEGSGYVVRRLDDTTTAPSNPVRVTGLRYRPPQKIYDQQVLHPGFGYLATRDNMLLSYMLRLPGPIEDGPYPTIVEYSGYDPSNPGVSGTAPSSRIANLLGYATIGVNIRGTGCSSGSFQLWEDAQATDGYDVIEAVAAQPWVLNHKVATVGLSYPGESQLYVAETKPPSLAGIAVAGGYDDGFRALLRPSGIVNSGFAKQWVKGRYAEAQPGGQQFARDRIAGGDTICANNQLMRGQNVDLSTRIDTDPYYPTQLGLGDSFAPYTFADEIDVPVFMAASWQDEQVGGHAASMIPAFTSTASKHFLLTNGGHTEALAVPDIMQRWDEFLQFYVRRRVPVGAPMSAIQPFIGQMVLDSPSPLTTLSFPGDRFTGMSYAAALASYEAEPQVRVLFENGGAQGVAAGLPKPAFGKDFATYPVPSTTATRWYLGAGGTLDAAAPTAVDDAAGSIDAYVSDPSARPRTSTTGGSAWSQLPSYNWKPPVAGKSLSYVSGAMAADTTMVGSGSVDLWLRSSAADTDLQVTLSEVRPDGKETYVQSGWLRTSARALDAARSTALQPLPTMLETDAAPLPAGTFTPVRVEIYPFAHVFRTGSKVRLAITAPGGDRIEWAFDTLPGTPTNEVARSLGRPSSIALPVIPGVSVPTPLPTCVGLRGQPCRTYTP